MRISCVQNNNNLNFNALQIRDVEPFYFRDLDISYCKNKLANTQVLDVVIDSHGLALKEKMTDVLHRIQSFSLFPLEKAVAVNMIGEKEPFYKWSYDTIEKAKNVWKKLSKIGKTNSRLNEYTIVTLWLDKNLRKMK